MTQEERRNKLALERMKKLKIVLVLTSGYLAAEVVGGLLTNSLALLADAGHMLTDVGGLTLALLAISYARRPATPHRTYGFYRLEILASLANSVVLVLLSVYILYEAYWRIFEPPEVQSLSMTIVAAIGLAVNLAGIRLIGSHHHNHGSHEHEHGHEEEKEEEEKSLNIEGARLELFSDTLGSIGVIAAGAVIMATGFRLADPIVSIGLAVFILPRTWSLLKKSVHILMEGVPSNISYEEVKSAILQVRGVTGIFDMHIWSITSGINALSAHVVVIDTGRSNAILQEINSLLEKRFRITHATIQIEKYHSSESGAP
ncbi:MAG: cation diffusion facilitator family transporter [Nitrososphaera sp.]